MNESNFDGAKKYVAMKRRQNWESLSGPGSSKSFTRDSVDFINHIIKKHNIKSILDLGCGDWNWFCDVDLSGCNYTGWDADELMIADNQSKYGTKNIKFFVKDIFNNEYPQVDLIICRDVLFHVKFELSTKLIQDAKQKTIFFLSTCFREEKSNSGPRGYCGIENWGYFRINLNIAPFNLLNKEIEHKYESRSGRPPRYLSLYKFG
jgi:2-polyprenyl-3-methyl-5-hydroxy-6-metoxy-1,4-benzoquinol methylase